MAFQSDKGFTKQPDIETKEIQVQHMVMLHDLMMEAANVINHMTAAEQDRLQVRYPLFDEMTGAAALLSDLISE